MPPKNIESCQLYVQTQEGYEPLATTESAEITSISFADSENAMDEFYIHLQAAINLTRSVIANIIQVLNGAIEPYEVNEMLHPRKKPRGSSRRKRRVKCQ